MKKILAVILSIGMLFSLAACGGGNNKEQTDGEGKTESKTEALGITKEEYEKMTADDLFNAIVKSSDSVTLDEFVTVIETYQYVDIAASVIELEKNITDDVRRKIESEYAWDKQPLSSEWVPLLITHESPQVRREAFKYSYPVYEEKPEFVTTVKEVMKTEKEPCVLFFLIQNLPDSLVASDPEVAEFVQKMADHENERIQYVAKSKLEDAAEAEQ